MMQMQSRTIFSRIQWLSIAAVGVFSACAVGFYSVDRQMSVNAAATGELAKVAHNHMLADMHHEGVRAIVFAAFAGDEYGRTIDEARKELDDTGAAYAGISKIIRNSQIPLELKEKLVAADLGPYFATARLALNSIEKDRAASLTSIKAVEAEFKRIFVVMEECSELISASIESLRTEAGWAAWYSKIMIIMFVVLGTVLFWMVSSIVLGSVLRPFHQHEVALGKLAAGTTDVEIVGLDRQDEVGEMARSINAFRDSVLVRHRQQTELEAERAVSEAEREKKEQLDKYYSEAHTVFMATFSNALERLSTGDLGHRLTAVYINEYETIRHSFNQAAERIQGAIVKVASNSNDIRNNTDRILFVADELARHTEEQASSLEETSASMEEMAATVRQNATNAQEASATAMATRELAAAGGKVAEQAVTAMEKIETSSRRVSEIVGLIEEIAFQTNILALNASVEAARAGDAGKGFAVVANEVRALSQRSSQSLKDIKLLISGSAVDVGSGAALVKKAGTTLTEVVSSVARVTELISEIAGASQEQAAGIDQVTRAVASMDEMTQQNAALVQETNAALHTAQQKIRELNRSVAIFETGIEMKVESETAGTEHHAVSNPVREQHKMLEQSLKPQRGQRKRVRAGHRMASAAAHASDDDWQEF